MVSRSICDGGSEFKGQGGHLVAEGSGARGQVSPALPRVLAGSERPETRSLTMFIARVSSAQRPLG